MIAEIVHYSQSKLVAIYLTLSGPAVTDYKNLDPDKKAFIKAFCKKDITYIDSKGIEYPDSICELEIWTCSFKLQFVDQKKIVLQS